MDKETLIETLLNQKADANNTIDLNSYALGLDAMYEALVSSGDIQRQTQLFCGMNRAYCVHFLEGKCKYDAGVCQDQVKTMI